MDTASANDIETWLASLDTQTTSSELHRGDWRDRFARELPNSYPAYFLSFDPNMCSRHHVRAPRPENIYPDDIATLRESIDWLPRVPTAIQVSTYSVNGPNSQKDVFQSVARQFRKAGFAAARVRADDAMMSMIFARHLALESNLEKRFRSWLRGRSLTTACSDSDPLHDGAGEA